MQKWEYDCHTPFFRMDRDRTNENIRTMLDGLDDYGAEGWELVSLIPHGHNVLDAVLLPQREVSFESYWKRPVADEEEE